jgi:hypothetical protein
MADSYAAASIPALPRTWHADLREERVDAVEQPLAGGRLGAPAEPHRQRLCGDVAQSAERGRVIGSYFGSLCGKLLMRLR